ncbi:MAG: hypothetical protein GY731_18810 [Gammaproteobacteria bacterium]|nr:hypothetical protein [Gammaproteobacteria bacterium]
MLCDLLGRELFYRCLAPSMSSQTPSKMIRVDQPWYPPLAVHEVLANAICHLYNIRSHEILAEELVHGLLGVGLILEDH